MRLGGSTVDRSVSFYRPRFLGIVDGALRSETRRLTSKCKRYRRDGCIGESLWIARFAGSRWHIDTTTGGEDTITVRGGLGLNNVFTHNTITFGDNIVGCCMVARGGLLRFARLDAASLAAGTSEPTPDAIAFRYASSAPGASLPSSALQPMTYASPNSIFMVANGWVRVPNSYCTWVAGAGAAAGQLQVHPATPSSCSDTGGVYCAPAAVVQVPPSLSLAFVNITHSPLGGCPDWVALRLFGDGGAIGAWPGPMPAGNKAANFSAASNVTLLIDPGAACDCDGVALQADFFAWPLAGAAWLPSPSPSSTATVTPSVSTSMSASASTSVSSSSSQSASASVSLSRSPTASASASGTDTASVSSTCTASGTSTVSNSAMASASTSVSTSATATPSHTATTSVTGSSSSSLLPSPSPSTSASASASPSSSIFAIATATPLLPLPSTVPLRISERRGELPGIPAGAPAVVCASLAGSSAASAAYGAFTAYAAPGGDPVERLVSRNCRSISPASPPSDALALAADVPLIVGEAAWPTPALGLKIRITNILRLSSGSTATGMPTAIPLNISDTVRWAEAAASALASTVRCEASGPAASRLLFAKPHPQTVKLAVGTDVSVSGREVDVDLLVNVTARVGLGTGTLSPLLAAEVWCRMPASALLAASDADGADIVAAQASFARRLTDGTGVSVTGCLSGSTASVPLLSRAPVVVWPALLPIPRSWSLAEQPHHDTQALSSAAESLSDPLLRCLQAGGVTNGNSCIVPEPGWNTLINSSARPFQAVDLRNPSGITIRRSSLALLDFASSSLGATPAGESSDESVEAESVNVGAGAQQTALAGSLVLKSRGSTVLQLPTAVIANRSLLTAAALWLPDPEDVCSRFSASVSEAAARGAAASSLRRSRPPCPAPAVELAAVRVLTSAESDGSLFEASAAAAAVCTAAQTAAMALRRNSSAESNTVVRVARRLGSIACPPLCDVSQLEAIADLRRMLRVRSLQGGTGDAARGAESTDLEFDDVASFAAAGAFGNATAAAVKLALESTALQSLAPVTSTSAASHTPLVALLDGFRFARQCSSDAMDSIGAGMSPLSVSCANHSWLPTSRYASVCVWGEGNDCVPCPTGGLCPGGYRLWSTPGWWVRAEDSLQFPVRCAFPAEDRCTGWDLAARTTACGLGYANGSYACSRCAQGFYADSNAGGACQRCPSDNSSAVQAALWQLL